VAAGELAVDLKDRADYHPNCWRCNPPTCTKIVSTERSLLLPNHRQHGVAAGWWPAARHHRNSPSTGHRTTTHADVAFTAAGG